MNTFNSQKLKSLNDHVVYHVTLETNHESIMTRGFICGHSLKNSFYCELAPETFGSERKLTDSVKLNKFAKDISREKAIYAYTNLKDVLKGSYGVACNVYAIILSSFDNVVISDTYIVNSILHLMRAKDNYRLKKELISYWENTYTPFEFLNYKLSIKEPEVLICKNVNPKDIILIGRINGGFNVLKDFTFIMKGNKFINSIKYIFMKLLFSIKNRF